MNRQEYNREIFQVIKEHGIITHPEFLDKLETCIETFPQQRFGQIICNYICWDYRDRVISEFTEDLMTKLFPTNPDPFYEESEETYGRILKNYEKL